MKDIPLFIVIFLMSNFKQKDKLYPNLKNENHNA